MKKILVVDDEPTIRKFLYEVLTREGCQVSTVPSGEEAIALVKKERPDLIILDLIMPGMDGIQTLQEIRSFDNEVDVVMLSGAVDGELERKAREVGASGVLPKGLEIDLFTKAVAKLLGGKEA